MNNMKKLLIILIGLIFTISLYSQETSKKDIVIQKITPMLHFNGVGGYLNFYNNDVIVSHGTDELNIDGGRLDINSNVKIGNSSTLILSKIDFKGDQAAFITSTGDTIFMYVPEADKVVLDIDTAYLNASNELVMLTSGGDTTYNYIPVASRYDADIYYPTITEAAGVPGTTPTKRGDMYINTSNGDIYIAGGISSSSDWKKVN